jgi:stress responsive alpha/beta barrel protein
MFRHMAILKFKADAKQEDIAAYFEAFPPLMKSLPVIKAWSIGRNQGAGGETHVKKHNFASNYDVGLTMDFDSAADYLRYAESPEHQAFFAKYCVPILAERVVAQFPTG